MARPPSVSKSSVAAGGTGKPQGGAGGSKPDYDVRPLGALPSPAEEEAAPAPASFGRRLVPRSRTEVVSEYWVRKCAAVGVLFRPAASPAHRPLPHALPVCA